MKVSKTDNRFKTVFPKPITGLPKKPILTSLSHFDATQLSWSCLGLMVMQLDCLGLIMVRLSWSCLGLILVRLSWSCLGLNDWTQLSWSCHSLVMVLYWLCRFVLVLVLSWFCPCLELLSLVCVFRYKDTKIMDSIDTRIQRYRYDRCI